jgi:hypothetical protein
MGERSIDWSTADVDANRVLLVNLSGESDETWSGAFVETVEVWGSETRGQTWGRIRLVRGAIVVEDVDPETEPASLQRHLNAAVDRANERAPEARAEAEREMAEGERRTAERADEARRMTHRFRLPPPE